MTKYYYHHHHHYSQRVDSHIRVKGFDHFDERVMFIYIYNIYVSEASRVNNFSDEDKKTVDSA